MTIEQEFSVTLESCRAPGLPVIGDVERIFELPAVIGHSSGGVTYDSEENLTRYGSTFTLASSSAVEAIYEAEKVWHRAHEELGLPTWPICIAEAKPFIELVADNNTLNLPPMVGITEIAELIGATRQRAHSLARSRRFPPPVAELGSGPVWLRSSVELFLEGWDRKPGRPRKDA